MVLRGHSSDSIGRHFGITTGTVKVHRKNIYAKLGISSQSELFSLFISYLSGVTASWGELPASRLATDEELLNS